MLRWSLAARMSWRSIRQLVRCWSSGARAPLPEGPGFKEFLSGTTATTSAVPQLETTPYLSHAAAKGLGRNRKVYFDVYGCQMNVNDTEVVWAILKKSGFTKTEELNEADIVLVMTCAIREGAETKVWNRLEYLKGLKNARTRKKSLPAMKIGIIGCMAERLKERLLERERAVDLVAGPDAYKDLPRLLALTDNNQTAVNVLLSSDETYADVMPVRLNQDSVTAFVSIMRGCDNMCTFCIVPFTRGRERSRPLSSILEEVRQLSEEGVKEVTLLGQNVNSYRDLSEVHHFGRASTDEETHMSRGFKTVYRPKRGGLRFADLLEKVSNVNSEMRIRFTSPHPKDFPDEVLHLIRERPNICNNLHLPAQSGNDRVLERMRRGYTRAAYLELVDHVRDVLPGVTLSSDFICGFCGETEQEFEDTLSLMERVQYHMAFLFPYSLREKTVAHRKLQDDVPSAVKQERLLAMVGLFRRGALKLNKEQIGRRQLILVEGRSKRSDQFLAGRNDGNTKVIIPAYSVPEHRFSRNDKPIVSGDYVVVQINDASSQVLKGTPLYHSTLSEFQQLDDYQGSMKLFK
ncbi:hypothetical protein R5R35_004282 [Gryllus longicercus]|uniref:CDK5RAP1-like protein n=1 Tax=Gryllus longicercus TaxID=2509291 RepID=A0AAN9VYY4_9ORTH